MSATLDHTATETAQPHPHAGNIQRFTAITDWLTRHPEARVDAIQADYISDRILLDDYGVHSAQELALAAVKIGGHWAKSISDTMFYLEQEIAPGAVYRLVALRETVCERVVTGTETKTIAEPDPELVAALPTVERTETIETVEWRCTSILSAGVDHD